MREDEEVKMILLNDMSLCGTFESKMNELITNPDVRNTIFTHNPIDHKKGKIFVSAREEYEVNPTTSIFDGFMPTIKDLEEYFAG